MAGAEQRLLVWLDRCASSGMACPSNEAIAARFGLGHTAPTRMLQRLRDAGFIKFEMTTRPRGRVVTIVATGRSTARPAGISPPRTRSIA